MVKSAHTFMAEDQTETQPKPERKGSAASEKLFKARERMRVEVEREEEVSPRTAKRETGEAFRVDWKHVDRADELLLADAEELHAKILQNPDRNDADQIKLQIDTLSEGVGREKNTPGDMEARMYGMGFLLQRNSEKLPGSIRVLVDRMERPRGYADYMEARRALEPEISKLGTEVGDKKAREVRNLLDRRRETNRLIDYFDSVKSGRKSLQERVIEAVGRDAPEQTLRRMVANGLEDAWRWLGFSELRPTTMYSQARLRMEREEADPVILMAVKVEEERGEVERDVTQRMEKEGIEAEAAAEETPEEAGERAKEEEAELPQEELEALDESDELVGKLRGLVDRLEAGEFSPEQEELLREIFGVEPRKVAERAEKKAARGVELGRVPTEEVEVSKSRVQELRDAGKSKEEAERIATTEAGTEAYRAAEAPEKGRDWEATLEDKEVQGWLRQIGKTPEEMEQDLDGLAEGKKGLQEFAEEVFSKDVKDSGKASKMRKVFYRRLRKELRSHGYKEDSPEDLKLPELRAAFNRAAQASMEKGLSVERKRDFMRVFWWMLITETWNELKSAAKEGMKEGQS